MSRLLIVAIAIHLLHRNGNRTATPQWRCACCQHCSRLNLLPVILFPPEGRRRWHTVA